MDLRKHYLTENDCYKAGEKITPKGGMLHSTGANNPKLSRYVDAPELAPISPNHWNTAKPGGRSVCVHGFIGLTPEKKVATYQTLPWNHRGWGGGGKSNDTHIHVEICEGDLDDKEYFDKVYREAVELFAYLANKFNWNPDKDIITHSEGHDQGIASNHADVMHWFPKHGKDMDDFRKDVKAEMADNVKIEQPITSPNTPPVAPKPAPSVNKAVSIEQLAQEVIDGKHGVGDARKESLGRNYEAVQARVNQLLAPKPAKAAPKPAPKPRKTTDQLAREVIDGHHGHGDARKKSLGGRYNEVQARVNQILGSPRNNKSISTLATEVIEGKHGDGRERMRSLGANYAAVQAEVTRRLRKR